MGHIIGDKNGDRRGIAVFLGEEHECLYWLTCRHVVEDFDQSLEIDGRPINVEHRFDADLALLSTAADKSKPSNPRTLSFAMPRDVCWMKTIPASGAPCAIHHTLSKGVHLTAAPFQVVTNQARFQYDFKELDSEEELDGYSGLLMAIYNDPISANTFDPLNS